MIAAENQSSLRAGSRLGQYEEVAGDGSVGGGNEAGGTATTTSEPGVMQKEEQETAQNGNPSKVATVATPSGVTTTTTTITMPGGGARSDDEEEEEAEEAEEEEEEDAEEEEDVEVEGGGGQEAVGGVEGGGGGGMAGFWRQSRPSSPRMPPPEQPEHRPKSRHEPAPARYNNLGYWRARRVTFYKNGDPYFPGIEFRFKPGRDIGSLEALLDRLSLRMDLPRGARHIFSMDGDRKITLDELEDGASYVVSRRIVHHAYTSIFERGLGVRDTTIYKKTAYICRRRCLCIWPRSTF